ncbi:MAG: hypothetical protein M3Q69_02485 [Acidobacteriota bacterium]|nr:hypothetical protein [Acidobacteriota bacterium]
MSPRFDPSALALDLAATTGAYDDVMRLMRTVGAYTSNLGALDLGGVDVHGAHIDPFYKLPGLREALAAARQHTPAWNPIAQDLFTQLLHGAYDFSPVLTYAASEIRKTIAAAEGAKRPLTAQEMTSIVSRLQSLQQQLRSHREKLTQLRTPAVDFIRLIAADYATLETGAQRIDEAVPAVEKATMDAAMKYALRPEGQGIYKMIVEEGARIREKLMQTTAAVHALADANSAAQKALQSILSAWATIEQKFSSVIATLSESERTTDAFVELPVLLDIAAESWQQLMTYFSGKLATTLI